MRVAAALKLILIKGSILYMYLHCTRHIGVQQKTTYKCIESEEEQETTEVEKNFQVSCFISQSESH